MSLEALKWALDKAPVKSGAERLILIALADAAWKDGTGAYISQQYIANRACCSVRTAQRHLSELESRGLIRRGDQSKAAHIPHYHRPVVWDLAVEMVEPAADFIAETPPDKMTPHVTRDVGSGVTPRHPCRDPHVTGDVTPTSPVSYNPLDTRDSPVKDSPLPPDTAPAPIPPPRTRTSERGPQGVARRLNSQASSVEAAAIVREYEKQFGKFTHSQRGEVAQAVDECLRAEMPPGQIAAGIQDWDQSEMRSPRFIPEFARKAGRTPKQAGVGTVTQSVTDWIGLFDDEPDNTMKELSQ